MVTVLWPPMALKTALFELWGDGKAMRTEGISKFLDMQELAHYTIDIIDYVTGIGNMRAIRVAVKSEKIDKIYKK